MRQRFCSRRGFTLAELLVVVAIVGILVSISIPVFNKQLEKSREAVDIANLRSAYSAARSISALGEFTVTDANGNNPKTFVWEANYPHEKGSSGNANPFFYDPPTGQIYYTCPAKPCGKGTEADGGTESVFFGKGEYRAAGKDYRDANIVIYFENSDDGGKISVYFGYSNADAVVQH